MGAGRDDVSPYRPEFTAALTLLAVDGGRIRLDDAVVRLAPGANPPETALAEGVPDSVPTSTSCTSASLSQPSSALNATGPTPGT